MASTDPNMPAVAATEEPVLQRRRLLVASLAVAYPLVALQPGWTSWALAAGLLPILVAGAVLGQNAGLVCAAWCALWMLTASALYLPADDASLTLTLVTGLSAPLVGWLVGRLRDGSEELRLRREQRELEQARLERVEGQGEAVLHALPHAVFRIDRAGKVLAATRPVGTRGADAVGKNIFDALPARLAEPLFEATLSSLNADGVCSFEYRRDEADGTPSDCEVHVVRAGEHEALAVVQDVSERQRLSRALAEAHENALQAAGTKGRFLATMSHQIRTPMNGVVGMTNVLLQTRLTTEQQEFTTIIRNSGEALLSILDDVLDFSTLEGGEMHLESELFNLRTTLEEVIELLSARAHDRGLEVCTLIDARVPDRVRGDRGRLRQVVTNLVGNALKFTERGQVVVRATVVGHERELARIRFDVTDTGRGISREEQKRLFQDYTQADAAIASEYGGTGLGLAISQQIVASMGGHMAVESEPGRGSTFSFTVRFETAPGRTTGSILLPSSLGGAQILTGPLHPLTEAVLQHELSPFGAKLTRTENSEALAQALTGRHFFDLVLLDLPLSASEDEVRRWVRATVRAAGHLPVCALHGIGRRALADAAREEGAALSLAKPLRRDALYESLGKLLGISARKPKRPKRTSEEPRALRARVLVVEDNLVNQKVATRTLELLGCDTEVAENGLLALEALARGRFDAVLMDCQMPIVDGFEATRRIRASEPVGAHVPIVAMTANAMAGDRERCLEAGMDDYIAKPVTPEALEATLRRWLPDELDFGSQTVPPRAGPGWASDGDGDGDG